MDNLRNCSIFLALLCTFLISDTFSSPIHGRKGHKGCYGGHHKHYHKRAVDDQPQIADLPSKMSLDNPQVKLYAQKGIEKLAETSTGPTDPILEKILDATFFDPAGKLLYEIKIEVGNKKTKDVSQECKVNVWRESDAEPSVTVECTQVRRRRADDDQPQIADLPTTLSIDDPKVKKYAQIAVDKMGGPSSEMKAILKEIVEAKSYPPSGKLLYTVKLKIGSTKCPKGSNEQNCEYDPEAGDNNCEISVFKETDEEDSTSVQCWRVARRRRASDGLPEVADLPSQTSVDDPQVKKYAQKGIEKLAEASGGSDPLLEKILEATFFPPAGKLLYEIKMKVGSKENKDKTQECTVNVWRESDAEPSVTVECAQARRRRADGGQPQIADLPTTLSIDDPKVKEYAQTALEQMGGHSSGMKGIVKEIVEAKSYPPSGKLLYTVKFKLGSTKCPKDSNEKNCEYDPEARDDDCEVNVLRETDLEPTVNVVCSSILRKRRDAEEAPKLPNLPKNVSIDDPEVRKYAQNAVDRFGTPIAEDKKGILRKINQAILYSRDGKDSYKIKMRVGVTNCAKGSEETNCEHNPEEDDVDCELYISIEKETNKELPQVIECTRAAREKRAVTEYEPQIADLPTTLSIDDPKVKEYAQKALDYVGRAGIVKEIVEAKSYPPSGKLLHTIKFKIGSAKCPKESNEKNCEYDHPEIRDDDCEVNVFRETDVEPRFNVTCSRIRRRRRDAEEAPKILNWPKNVSIDDPEVRKYAQNAVDRFGTPIAEDKKGILREIKRAVLYSRDGKDNYMIKMRVGVTNCAKGSEETNCEHNPEEDDVDCELYITTEKETNKELSQVIECTRDKRAPNIPTWPKNMSIDDPEVRKYAQNAVDRFGTPIAEDKKGILREINQAVLYSRDGKDYYMIKMRVGVTNCAKGSEETNCEHNPEEDDVVCDLYITTEKETDKELSQGIECTRAAREKRAVTESEPQIADLPTTLSIDDPKVKEYAQMALDKMGGHSSGMKGIVKEIVEAKSYPPSGKILYTVKLKIGATKCPKGSNEKNCEYDPEAGDDNCEISVFKETDEEDSTGVQCWRVDRRRRASDGVPEIADLPSQTSVDDPQVKKYAEKGIEKLAEASSGSDPILEKILEATFFPPAGKLLYEIKMKVGSKENKDKSQECTVNVWRESDAEPSVTVDCVQARRRRADDDDDDEESVGPLILDKPLQVSVDDPEVKKYAQKGVEIYAESSTGPSEPILEKIEEALMFPPVGTMLFEVKIKIGTSTCAKGQKENCELKADGESKSCTVKVFIESEKPRVELECN